MLTDYHPKYFAYELTKRCSSDSVEKLAGAVAGAQVDLNPHQVDAALFAFNSPLSKGALLADEVGLGKTIKGLEANTIMQWERSQRRKSVPTFTTKTWAELRKYCRAEKIPFKKIRTLIEMLEIAAQDR